MKHKNLTITDAKHICRMCQGTGVIVVVFDDRSRGLAGVSYGLDRRRCQARSCPVLTGHLIKMKRRPPQSG